MATLPFPDDNTGTNTNVNPRANVYTPTGTIDVYGGIPADDPRRFRTTTEGTQTGTTQDTTQQSTTGFTQSGSTTQNLAQQYGLNTTQTQQLQNLFSNIYGQTAGQTQQQVTGGTTVTDPINFLNLLREEQAIAELDTLGGTQALANIVSGQDGLTVDRQAYLDLADQAAQEAIIKATSGPQALGLGETDRGRIASQAGALAQQRILQNLLGAETEADINELAARVQGAETLAQGGASTQLFAQAMPVLAQLFGEQTFQDTTGQTFEQTQQTQQQTTQSYLSSIQEAQNLAQELGQANNWSQEQIDSFTQSLSQSIANSFGISEGVAPVQTSGGGGTYICTVMNQYGYVDDCDIQVESKFMKAHGDKWYKEREGYEIWGKKVAGLLDKSKILRTLVAPFVMDYIDAIYNEKQNLTTRFVQVVCLMFYYLKKVKK